MKGNCSLTSKVKLGDLNGDVTWCCARRGCFFSLHISRISQQITFTHSSKTLRTGKQWNKSSLADIQVTLKSTFIQQSVNLCWPLIHMVYNQEWHNIISLLSTTCIGKHKRQQGMRLISLARIKQMAKKHVKKAYTIADNERTG